MDEEELEGEPTKVAIKTPSVEPVAISELAPIDHSIMFELALADPIIGPGPSSAKKTTPSLKDAPTTVDPLKKFGS